MKDGGGRPVEVELPPDVVLGAQHSARLQEALRGLADVAPVVRPAVATRVARPGRAASPSEPEKIKGKLVLFFGTDQKFKR